MDNALSQAIRFIGVFVLAACIAQVERTQGQSHPPLSEAALRARLFAYADDSMRGRKAGSAENDRATTYIADELRRMGAEPAGENGSFFQTVRLNSRMVPDSSLVVSVNGRRLQSSRDYLPRDNGANARAFDGAATVFGGVWGDTATLLPGNLAAGKIVVIGLRPGEFAVVKAQLERRYAESAAIAVANLDAMSGSVRQLLASGPVPPAGAGQSAAVVPSYMHLSVAIATELFGAPASQVRPGAQGPSLRGSVRFAPKTFTARNVVAVVRGSDPRLRGQYVALGSHNDHEGVGDALDADSLRAFNLEVRRRQILAAPGSPPAQGAIRVNMDSIRRVHPRPRMDSIYNGADDDGSGTVAMLEIARAVSGAAAKPRRSVLFVFHTAEEDGLVGSDHFTKNPTVSLDSIVAHINLDMIGRGGVGDEANGGPAFLHVIGARRRSTQLGDIVEQVSREKRFGWRFDYALDAPGHPEQVWCRSDHYSYARFGIPVVFFSTGIHADYHQVTDEPSRVDYAKLARVSSFVHDLTLHLGNMDGRVVSDKPRPDPAAPCVH